MQLTCPGCGARYHIDATSWPTDHAADGQPVHRPRRARCKICRTVWEALPEEEILELDDPLPPEEEPHLADAAWASVAGWPDPRPLPAPAAAKPNFTPVLDQPPPIFSAPGTVPPRDPAASVYAAPSRPAIHFETPAAPVPPQGAAAVRPRLMGPGARLRQDEDYPEAAYADDDQDDDWNDEDQDDDEAPRRRHWLWVAAGVLALLGVIWFALVVSGRVQPERYGLPPFNPAAIGLDRLAPGAVGIGKVKLPALPRTPPPPLLIEADAVKRQLSGNRSIWEVKGLIRNPTQSRHPVPPVEILLLAKDGEVVSRWMVRPQLENLAPGGEARFETSAIDPPASATRIRLQLKPGELGRL